jgi:hypothetical protein
MKNILTIVIPTLLILKAGVGCTSPRPVTAWEHLRIALELDEESVVEYMAAEYLPAIVAYDPGSTIREAVFLDPAGSISFITLQYPEATFDQMLK